MRGRGLLGGETGKSPAPASLITGVTKLLKEEILMMEHAPIKKLRILKAGKSSLLTHYIRQEKILVMPH